MSEEGEVMTTGGVAQYPCRIECSAVWDNDETLIEFQRVLEKAESRTKFDGSNPMRETVGSWEARIEKAEHVDKDDIFPLVLYLSSARLWNESSSSSRSQNTFARMDAYSRSLDRRHGIEFAVEYIQQLQAVATKENEGRHFPAYDAILDAVNVALKDELAQNEKVIFSTRYSKDIVALRTAEGTVVPFATLSDGYRNVIKIILDIATRMCVLNPYLKKDALRKTPGIVVIDEIDLSLHPTWQRKIIGILKELFPKIQFICATHSPFIIQSPEEGELHSLDAVLEDDYSGESIEDIAEDIMGVEMPQYSEKKRKMFDAAQKFFCALDECRSDEELEILRKTMDALEAEYSDNPAYLALIRQQEAFKEWEIKRNETNQ